MYVNGNNHALQRCAHWTTLSENPLSAGMDVRGVQDESFSVNHNPQGNDWPADHLICQTAEHVSIQKEMVWIVVIVVDDDILAKFV